MGVVESVADGFVGLDDAEARLSPEALARRQRLIGRAVMAAIVLTQVAWFACLIIAAWVFVFS
jgi:hypothetical protein